MHSIGSRDRQINLHQTPDSIYPALHINADAPFAQPRQAPDCCAFLH